MEYIELKIIDEEKRIFLLTLNRPTVKNALNREVIHQLTETIDHLEQEKLANVVILQGKEHHFAAGSDIKEMLNANEMTIENIVKNVHSLHKKMSDSNIVFISSIEGYCLGGGFELALATDMRIVSKHATFGLPEVKLGILPGGWGTQKFLTIAGSSNATRYLLTGDFFNADMALSMNLVSEVVEDPLLQSKEIAMKIASQSNQAIRSIKKLLIGIEYSIIEQRLQLEQEAFKQLLINGEAQEGLGAFVEKRQPNYRK
ncbi:enoyl-CoA hydratase/isomerase family protein [Viridibacillus sp. NPDC093762]|uniref:enoyl-CoA hydratase/isomerase family protein n=1 Tax=Viridibacillus sp. NPDC093762 TaxID=3390720 RepID=UPI003D082B73